MARMPRGETQRVFVGNLAPDVRPRDIEDFFKGYGKLGDISLKNGYGFVDFEDTRDAEDAAADLDGKNMNGDRIRVELAYTSREKERARKDGRGGFGGGSDRYERRDGGRGRSPPPRGGRPGGGRPPGARTNYRIIIENLSTRTSWQDLKDYFRTAGDITYTSAHKIRSGEGLVEFADRDGMRYALDKLDGEELDGKKLRLAEEKRGGRMRTRSRSPAPRRSRSPAARRSRSPAARRSKSRSRSPKRSDSRRRSRS